MIPYSIESEQALIGRILLSNAAYDRVVDLLTADCFYEPAHREIYRAIQQMLANNRPVDVVTLDAWLIERDLSDVVGGLGYLGTLANQTPGAANVRTYAEIIASKAKLRGAMHLASELIDAVQEANGKDADEIIGNYSSQLEALTINKSDTESLSIFDVAERVVGHVQNIYNTPDGECLGVKTGLTDLDSKLHGLKEGEVIIVAGRPGMGKTSLAMNIADSAAKQHGHVLVFSMEMSAEQLGLRQAASLCNIRLDAMQGGTMEVDEFGRLRNYLQMASESLSMTIDFRGGLTPAQLRAKARQIARKHKDLSLIVIDYLQLMTSDRKTDNRTQELSEISRQIKALAKELHVPIIALSQLNRAAEQRADKRPMLSDLRESGSIEQDADTVLLIYRDDYYNPDSQMKGIADINIAKNRMGQTGCWVKTLFQGEYSRFSNLSRDWVPPVEEPKKRKFSYSFAK